MHIKSLSSVDTWEGRLVEVAFGLSTCENVYKMSSL